MCKQVAATVHAKTAKWRRGKTTLESMVVAACLFCVRTGCSNRAGGEDARTNWRANKGKTSIAQRQAKNCIEEVKLMRHQTYPFTKTLIGCPLLLLLFVELVLVCALLEWTAHHVQHPACSASSCTAHVFVDQSFAALRLLLVACSMRE